MKREHSGILDQAFDFNILDINALHPAGLEPATL
jgi:hypothetical protein